MDDVTSSFAPIALAVFQVILAGVATAHVVLHKRSVSAAAGWVGLIWLVPFGGAVLYGLLGINRIQRRATHLRELRFSGQRTGGRAPAMTRAAAPHPAHQDVLDPVASLVERVTKRPLTDGNAMRPLVGGTQAYERMLAAIDSATRTVGLATYIFDDDPTGQAFVDALDRAHRRGVEIRVLVDGVGALYSRPSIVETLRRRRIPVAEFLPRPFPFYLQYANLRNHRKILVIDGRIGFTGGMNIRDGHRDDAPPDAAIRDIHFEITGPVVAHLSETFIEDWVFASGEQLQPAPWLPALGDSGPVKARGIASGPDEAYERLQWVIQGVLSQARQRVRIVTPYFLPDESLQAALATAALRGVQVDILFPRRNNLRLVGWASLARIGYLIERGCRVWLTAPPFDHAKVMTVDGRWSLIGSANWDQRSLHLNFEFSVECYDGDLAKTLDALIDARQAEALPLTAEALAARSLALRLRDGAAWLLSPYL